jgi:microcystin-dependent protein
MALTPNLKLPYPTTDDTVDVPRDIGALANAVDTQGTVPVGAFMMWPTAVAPAGWLLMQGQLVDGATNPGLATLLGQDANGKVAIPDMRDMFPVGAGVTALGTNGGAASVLLTSDQSGMRPHNHGGLTGARDRSQQHIHGAAAGSASLVQSGTGSGAGLATGGGGYVLNYTGGIDPADHLHSLATEAATNANQAHENRPPFRAINFIIRAG